MSKIFKNPRKSIRIINIVFLILVLFFIGNVIYGLVNGTRTIDCLFTSGLLFLIMLSCWINSVRPFYERIEKEKIIKRKWKS